MITWTPNRIEIQADGPGRLILSELAYPGWRARLDGKPVALQAAVILRALDLPSGLHTIVFEYRPVALYAGVLVSCLGWLGIAFFALRERRETR